VSFSRRVNLAVEQLELALTLFLEKQSYVAALTLAGAVEEILGKALTLQGEKPSLHRKFQVSAPVHAALHRKPLRWSDFTDRENLARHAAKHMESVNDATGTIDLEDAAIWMIVRACDNYDRLGRSRTGKMTEFDEWFYEHVVGV
jgi:hypothetical protein